MWIEDLAVFLFGLIVGSFLNVCISRLPREESVVSPRSRCPECGRPIRALENIPILSYLFLRGRCRGCGKRISWVYPTVELLTGVLFLLTYWKFGLTPPFFLNVLFVSMLVALVFIDMFERILPDLITLGGCIIGFGLAPLQSPEFLGRAGLFGVADPVLSAYLESLLGILLGGGFLWLVAAFYLKVRRIEGMGFGDIKMMAMAGAFIGWKFAWLTILLGSFLGAIIGGAYIYLLNRGRMYELPFGTFLGAAAVLVLFEGPRFLNWYLHEVLGS